MRWTAQIGEHFPPAWRVEFKSQIGSRLNRNRGGFKDALVEISQPKSFSPQPLDALLLGLCVLEKQQSYKGMKHPGARNAPAQKWGIRFPTGNKTIGKGSNPAREARRGKFWGVSGKKQQKHGENEAIWRAKRAPTSPPPEVDSEVNIRSGDNR